MNILFDIFLVLWYSKGMKKADKVITGSSVSYISKLLKSRKVQKLAGMSLWSSVKDFTESVAVANACYKYSPWGKNDSSVGVFVIGDGRQPQTGALIASETAWSVHSCDPRMKRGGLHRHIERLWQHKKKAEHCLFDLPFVYSNEAKLIIVAPHSHANLRAVVDGWKRRCSLIVISLPCCVPDGLGDADISYNDMNCLSPKRRVNVYFLGNKKEQF